MTSFTIRQLRYFEALAAHGNFGRAAEACSISQPAISVQIKELETTIGSALFERTARRVRLTGFGEEFATRARQILFSVDDLEDWARMSKDGLVGRLRIGIIPTIAPYLLPRIVGNLNDSNAGLDIHIRETLTHKLILELIEGRLDAAIVALPISEPTLVEIELFEENFVLVRQKEAANGPVPDSDALQGMKLLLLEEGHCFREQALSFCGIGPKYRRDGMDGSSLSTLVQMAGAGIGVTLIPEMAVPLETQFATVAVTRFKAPQPSRKIGMIWRKTSPLTKQLRQISDVVRQSAEELRKEQS